MAFLTVDEAKLLLGITTSTKDDTIEFLIPIVEADIREYCNIPTGDLPSWMKLPASQMIGYQLDPNSTGLKSESQGGYSYTKQDLIGGYPGNVMQSLNKGKVARSRFPDPQPAYRELRGLTETQLASGIEPRGDVYDEN